VTCSTHGGEQGFNQAIESSADTLTNVKLLKEKKLLQQYMDEIAQDTGKYCFMVEDTLKALELGAVEELIIWDNLETQRFLLRNQSTGEEKVIYLNKDQESEDRHFRDPVTNVELDTIEKEPLVEWFANNYKQIRICYRSKWGGYPICERIWRYWWFITLEGRLC
jgi:peptide chain release factor subunit 1